jgi:hypothetical protein
MISMFKQVPTSPLAYDEAPNPRNRWFVVRGERVFGRWRTEVSGKKVSRLSPSPPPFTITAAFHHHRRLSPSSPPFTITAAFHHHRRLSPSPPPFTITTAFHLLLSSLTPLFAGLCSWAPPHCVNAAADTNLIPLNCAVLCCCKCNNFSISSHSLAAASRCNIATE